MSPQEELNNALNKQAEIRKAVDEAKASGSIAEHKKQKQSYVSIWTRILALKHRLGL